MPISSEAAKAERSETRGLPYRVQADPKRPAPTEMWGDDIVRSRRKRRAVMRALSENWEVSANGCWEWNLGKSHGYGQIRVHEIWGDTPIYAHRASYLIHKGPIPTGMVVRHRCDNPSCLNPEHLLLGSQADNIADMVARGRQCLGEANGMSKLTDKEVKAIRSMKDAGMTGRAIAALFKISEGHVSTILKGKKRGTAGGPLSGVHGGTKYPEALVFEAIELRNSGVPMKELMERYGLTDSQIRQVLYSERTKQLLAKRGNG